MNVYLILLLVLLIERLNTVTSKLPQDENGELSFTKEGAFNTREHNPVDSVAQLSYNTGDDKDNRFRHEKRLPNGAVRGFYGYRDKNGDLFVRHYIVDVDGYRLIKEERYPSSNKNADNQIEHPNRNVQTYLLNFKRQIPSLPIKIQKSNNYYPIEPIHKTLHKGPFQLNRHSDIRRPLGISRYNLDKDKFYFDLPQNFPTQFSLERSRRRFFLNRKNPFPQFQDGFNNFGDNQSPADINYDQFIPFNKLESNRFLNDHEERYFRNINNDNPASIGFAYTPNNNGDNNRFNKYFIDSPLYVQENTPETAANIDEITLRNSSKGSVKGVKLVSGKIVPLYDKDIPSEPRSPLVFPLHQERMEQTLRPQTLSIPTFPIKLQLPFNKSYFFNPSSFHNNFRDKKKIDPKYFATSELKDDIKVNFKPFKFEDHSLKVLNYPEAIRNTSHRPSLYGNRKRLSRQFGFGNIYGHSF
ncbi:uncharacterized protein LOC143224287 [Tachypleus tridentatus]|uniref:uncharacterized protein LOC143224287 n=1 Tax=Tachypleus tridentatus TaxID=6853 RepID=UPI003FCFFA48